MTSPAIDYSLSPESRLKIFASAFHNPFSREIVNARRYLVDSNLATLTRDKDGFKLTVDCIDGKTETFSFDRVGRVNGVEFRRVVLSDNSFTLIPETRGAHHHSAHIANKYLTKISDIIENDALSRAAFSSGR